MWLYNSVTEIIYNCHFCLSWAFLSKRRFEDLFFLPGKIWIEKKVCQYKTVQTFLSFFFIHTVLPVIVTAYTTINSFSFFLYLLGAVNTLLATAVV